MKRLALSLAATLAATPALAHPGAAGGFAAGIAHPLSGADHLLAMVAVGLWAGLCGGRAMGLLPSAFVGAMTLGFSLALAGLVLPGVEPMILASVIVLGALVALAVRMELRVATALVALFGLFHGWAHGAEAGGAALAFAPGFVLATVLLHAAGVGLGRSAMAARGLGLVTAAAGLVLTVG